MPSSPTDSLLDYENRYPNWVPVSYELQREDAVDKVKTEFSGMPNDANTKAWDELITRSFSPATRTTVLKEADSDMPCASVLLFRFSAGPRENGGISQ